MEIRAIFSKWGCVGQVKQPVTSVAFMPTTMYDTQARDTGSVSMLMNSAEPRLILRRP
jgi:hypothetical protein